MNDIWTKTAWGVELLSVPASVLYVNLPGAPTVFLLAAGCVLPLLALAALLVGAFRKESKQLAWPLLAVIALHILFVMFFSILDVSA